MINSPRLPLILLIALLTVGAGCSSDPSPGAEVDSKNYPAITPKPYMDDDSAQNTAQRAPQGPAYYGPYHERYGLGTSFDASGWSAEELKAASFIHGSNIYFHFDSAELTKSAKEVLGQKAARIKAYPNLHTLIAGHSDERGSDDYNMRLGERRAKAAYDYLVSLGVPAQQLGTVSFGKRFPMSLGNDDSAWSQNRRDEFMVSKKP